MNYWFIIIFCIVIIFLLSLFFPSANVFFHFAILRKHRKILFESEYFRNILLYSPSEVLYIYNKCRNNKVLSDFELIEKYKKMFYINLLKMSLLGYVKIDFSKGDNFKIIKKNVIILDEEYKMIYDYIFTSITNNSNIMLYDINNYVEQNYKNNSFFEKWDKLVRKKLDRNGFCSTDFITIQGAAIKKYYMVVIPILVLIEVYLLIFIYSFGVPMLFVFPALAVAGYYESKNIKIMSNRSIYEYKKIKALERFLKDFTIINERSPEYIRILDDYIVYASIFDMLDTKKSIDDIIVEIKNYINNNR